MTIYHVLDVWAYFITVGILTGGVFGLAFLSAWLSPGRSLGDLVAGVTRWLSTLKGKH